ncbi:hypothetical protein ILYODFUR_019440 [Ilyodon furcidens]|uniref:Uncharacterized protein n=1 Tax=Ilyodon furcidens TaxID=33524 RepID=A0ABV0UHB6_9TELE
MQIFSVPPPDNVPAIHLNSEPTRDILPAVHLNSVLCFDTCSPSKAPSTRLLWVVLSFWLSYFYVDSEGIQGFSKDVVFYCEIKMLMCVSSPMRTVEGCS